MEAMDGPQWKQLPMLMTPEEVRGSHSAVYNMPMGDVKNEYIRNATQGKYRDHTDLNKVAALKNSYKKTNGPLAEFPAVIRHDGVQAGFSDGHHRATAAMETGHLLPVVHTEGLEDSWNTADKQESSPRGKAWIRKWGE